MENIFTIIWKIQLIVIWKKSKKYLSLCNHIVCVIKHGELETLIIASIETLKRQKMMCGIDEVFELVQDSLKEIFLEKVLITSQVLIDYDSVKSNSVSNRVCLSITKNNTSQNTVSNRHFLRKLTRWKVMY